VTRYSGRRDAKHGRLHAFSELGVQIMTVAP
jgi:hypothetical protein